jgi:hypothetical protein
MRKPPSTLRVSHRVDQFTDAKPTDSACIAQRPGRCDGSVASHREAGFDDPAVTVDGHRQLGLRAEAVREGASARFVGGPAAIRAQGRTFSSAGAPPAPQIVRQPILARHVGLRDELTGTTLTENLRRVADAQYRAALAAHDSTGEIEKLRQTVTDADVKIARHRAALDAGGDPALIAGWISEATAIKKSAQARLGLTEAPPQRMTADQLDAIADAFRDLLALLRDADPRDKAELYSRLGLRMTYRPGRETVIAEVVTPATRVFDWCPRGIQLLGIRVSAH